MCVGVIVGCGEAVGVIVAEGATVRVVVTDGVSVSVAVDNTVGVVGGVTAHPVPQKHNTILVTANLIARLDSVIILAGDDDVAAHHRVLYA